MTDITNDERQAARHLTAADVAAVAVFTTAIIESANAANEPQEGLVVWPGGGQGEQSIQITQPSNPDSGTDRGDGGGDDPSDPSSGSGEAPDGLDSTDDSANGGGEAPGW